MSDLSDTSDYYKKIASFWVRFFYTFYAILQHFCTKTCYKTLFFTRNLKKNLDISKKNRNFARYLFFKKKILVYE